MVTLRILHAKNQHPRPKTVAYRPLTHRQTHRQTDRQTDRQKDKKKKKQREKQGCIH